MLPVLSHIETVNDINFWITTDRVVGCSFRISSFDIETGKAKIFHEKISESLKVIPTQVLARVSVHAKKSHKVNDQNPRKEALEFLGHTVKDHFLHLEFRGGFLLIEQIKSALGRNSSAQSQFDILSETAEIFQKAGLNLKTLEKSEVSEFFASFSKNKIFQSDTSVETLKGSIGVFRMLSQPEGEFSIEDWVRLQGSIPKPYQLWVSFRKISEAQDKILLERALKQTEKSNDVTHSAQHEEIKEHLLENFKSGAKHFEMEVILLVPRDHLGELSKQRSEIRGNLARFSEFDVETFGAIPSYCATIPGNLQHVPLYESHKALAAFLPLWGAGSPSTTEGITLKHNGGDIRRTLSVYRQDKSLFNFDLFNPEYNVYNSVIIGTSGKGKSVLTGLLTTSLLNDPNLRIIKLDVGGSHSSECELFGGEEFKLRLDEPSGINPFEVVGIKASDSEKVGILSKFLESLIREQGESILSKSLRSEIEQAVRIYAESSPQNPSLDDFYLFAQDFPRRDLLRRWVKGGLYESSFCVRTSDEVQLRTSGAPPPAHERYQARLKYYNFSQIFQAADPEFAQSGIAAVLAQFNMEVLKSDGKRLVLICDEVPFFIKHCFDFFKFTTANVRKYGHSVVLISQLSTDLIVNGDTGIIENSPQRFLFSSDGEERAYQERLNLSENDMKTIKNLRTESGIFSECLFQTSTDTRKLRIEVTREEYWRLTTSKIDKDKLINLMAAVPRLTLREAIRCLSAADF